MARYDRKDHYHQRAKSEGFRSRAVYKLAELQRAHRILSAGQRVADLGCWPGGWLQEAARAVGRRGRVVGVDLAAVDPPFDEPNIIAFVGDFEDPKVCERVLEELGGPCAALLSDAAPKLTGIRAADRAAEERVLEAVEAAVPRLLAPGGILLMKILECPEAATLEKRLRRHFDRAKTVKTAATRKGSTERYLLARGYAGES